MATVTLKNGVQITGEINDISKILELMGESIPINPRTHYYSQSKRAWLYIPDMETHHLRNAALKMLREWAQDLSAVKSNKHLVVATEKGCENVTFEALINELYTREDE